MKEILNHLFEQKSFGRHEAKQILTDLAKGKYNPSQMAAFITAYCMRLVTVDELAGFRDAMLELCLPAELGTTEVIDLCGTGGDGKDTFNISTLASFVVAGAGYKVAKHGNYGVSSGCGSSNVMEHLGYKFTNDNDTLRRQLETSGICFLHAPLFHPAMRTIAPIRKELGVKTFFNMLGPLVNPANPDYQIAGVFSLELARLYAYLYQQSGKQYTILHGLDGYDEVSLTGNFKTFTKSGEQVQDIESLGFEKIDAETISGGSTVAESAEIFKKVLNGDGSNEQQNVVVFNAALAIRTIHPEKSFGDCYYEAEESLVAKKALLSFTGLLN